MPVLLGDDDDATPPTKAPALVGLVPGARFEELAASAHVPQLPDTARFVAAAEGFLGRAR